MRKRVLLAWLVVALTAGCLSSADPAPEAAPAQPLCPTPATEGQDPGANAAVPLPWQDGFEPETEAAQARSPLPRRATDGTWTVQADAGAYEGGSVMVGQGDAEPGFSSLLFPVAGEPADVEVSVAFRIGCVEHPHGVGVVLHVGGSAGYQIVRYSASESSWDLFTVRGGERTRQDAARVADHDPVPGEWALLRVVSRGDRVQAYDGDTLVLDFRLTAADTKAGQVGLFLRGNSDAAFDVVCIVPGTLPADPGVRAC